MVENKNQIWNKSVTELHHSSAMFVVLEFFPRLKQVQLQLLNKRYYNSIIPNLLAGKKIYGQKTQP